MKELIRLAAALLFLLVLICRLTVIPFPEMRKALLPSLPLMAGTVVNLLPDCVSP